MSIKLPLGVALGCCALYASADDLASRDPAAAFGARPSVSDLRLSPDGSSVSFIMPDTGQGSTAYTLSLAPGAKARPVLHADGNPLRLDGCDWVSGDRLICTTYAVVPDPDLTIGMIPVTRVLAVNADGSNVRLLTTKRNEYSRGYLTMGGEVIDWLPDENGAVLMTRQHLPDSHLGSHIGSDEEGLGVDWVDTRTLAVKHVQHAHAEAGGYITDGRGTVRIAAYSRRREDLDTGTTTYMYRLRGSEDWRRLSEYNWLNHSGFYPVAVDYDKNVAYGFKKLDGRFALYSMSLDESPHEELIYSRPDVDLDDVIRIGRRRRVVGVSYSTDVGHAEFFAPEVRQLVSSLAKALPRQPLLQVVDASVDENKMVVFASSDADPGEYYIFDRKSNELRRFFAVRDRLEGTRLAHVKAVSYPAADGVMIPGYLTLPPGTESAHNLPAIVLPHGGPSARDAWGFDWLAQFYAARGFAVLQPNFRGSSGYGDTWFEKNGFQSWEIAIGDVLAAGRWLAHEGIADPSKLAIVGWSYGGYAALQSSVVDPKLFKAVVAIAPVTDLETLKEEFRYWSNARTMSDFIGSGPHMHAGSPIEHASSFQVPVLLFHGTTDANVSVEQSKHMAAALKSAGARCELVIYPDRDHQLEDSEVRADMLRKSDAFLRQALGISASRVTAAADKAAPAAP